jgi:signal transduction histidine kinase
MDLNIPFLILVGSTLYNLSLIFLVLVHGPRTFTKFCFVLMNLGIIAWLFSNYFSNFINQYQLALWFNKLIFFTTSLAAYFFALFSYNFPDKRPQRKLFYFFTLILLINLGLSLSTLIVKDIVIRENFSEIIFNPGIHFYSISILFFLGYSFIALYTKWKREKELNIRSALFTFWVGMGIFIALSIVTNLLFPVFLKEFQLTNFVPLYSTFFLGSITFAILRYEFLVTKVILTEFLVMLIGMLLLIQLLIFPTLIGKIIIGTIFLLFCIFGYLLIRSVLREIKLREEVERISQAKSEFISIASHQLRTPLSAIKGYLSMILEGSYGNLPEKVKRPMENVYQSNERLIKLVNDILSVSKIEAGEMEMNWEKEDLREIIKEVISELSIKAKEKNLYLKFEEPKEFPKILLDREKIRQVILNLVDNAIRYTQEGGVTVKLQIANGKLQIVVSDTGEGLTKEEKEKLFERFSRGTAGTKFWTEGAGLGLYIARRFVEMHKGRIWAESEGRGKGSIFYVELPMK